MKKGLISIIIPIYNTEKYIYKCLDSILSQTYTNWEAILVDDGSTDRSSIICDEYAEKDNRFKVIHQENGGVSAARLNGFKLCHGEYISFLDSDDTLPKNALEILHSETQTEWKYICGSMTLIYPENRLLKLYEKNRDIYSSDIIKSILLFERKYSWELPGKLFHRSILDIETLTVPSNIKVFEDYVITLRILNKIKNVKYISDNTYNYIIRESSATHTNKQDLKKVEDLNKEVAAVCNKEHYKEEFIRCKLQMLGWIIEDDGLYKNSEWFQSLLKECKKIKLSRIDKLQILLVKLFRKGRTRKKILKFFLRLK